MKKELFYSIIGLALLAGCASTKEQRTEEQQTQVSSSAEQETQQELVGEEQAQQIDQAKMKAIAVAIDAFNKFAKKNAVYFAFDSDDVNDNVKMKKYQSKIEALNKLGGVKLTVNGYCDKVGSVEYNNLLGLRRAQAVKNIVSKIAEDDVEINVVSFGKSQYRVYTKNVFNNNRANRRVELVASAK